MPLDAVLRSTSPLVVRGLVAHWPAVQAARQSSRVAAAYLRRFANDALPAVAMTAPPDAGGRIFYDSALRGFNFRQEQVPLSVALNTLVKYLGDDAAPMIYLGATTLDTFLPGLQADNRLDLGDRDPLASIWIGNRSRVPTHQDLPDNLACVVAGRRRVTLFPPEQLGNLYIGPLEFTPAGQPVSLVDPDAPDLQRFPRFAEAWRHALVAELGPGDAVLIPGMWWHHMAALDGFNVLVNYWWRDAPAWMASPVHALHLAILTLRELPPHQREVWREVFSHYVFDADATTAGHIPEAARGMLAPLDGAKADELLSRLRKALAR
ncbi:cupin-like domain-containing protein [Luteimonas sp. BDR2-5]|uniref:cupin-like domain-containing protein n=1 Tax=Proluteimonas luteida TaxID=2878685 RepID=UPI001E35BD90|nr:cupin-like domain-containing protein [Luteimonas sp. BDR2-5]MCD9027267.1 cupin-like domain-containing protein [Luteimonas sp. BDR2-5]